MALRALLVAVVVLALATLCPAQLTEEEQAQVWAVQYNLEAEVNWWQSVAAEWTYNTNITEFNLNNSLSASSLTAEFDKSKAIEANLFDWASFTDDTLKRQFSKIVDIGYATLPPPAYYALTEVTSQMETIYSTATVCNRPGDSSGACYPLDPGTCVSRLYDCEQNLQCAA